MASKNVSIERKGVVEKLQYLKDWVDKQPHLPKDFDEKWLFVVVCGTSSLEKAKQKLDSYCTYRTSSPRHFIFPYNDPLDQKFKDACNFTNVFFLPNTTPEGYRVFFVSGHNIEHFDHHLINTRLIMVLEAAVDVWPDTTGFIGVLDSKGADPKFIRQQDMQSAITTIMYIKESLPMKIKNVIVFNSSTIVEMIINGIMLLVKHKFAKKMAVTSQDESFLEKYFPLEMLPSDYKCGKAPSMKELNDQWLQEIDKRRDWYSRNSKLCSDEMKRPPISDSSHNDSVEGSFRYLNID